MKPDSNGQLSDPVMPAAVPGRRDDGTASENSGKTAEGSVYEQMAGVHTGSASNPKTISAPTMLTPPQADDPIASTDDISTTRPIIAQLAQDKDLIEKTWVDKAKHIVETTRDNPYKQNEELTNLKADYMKQQFNKTIKLTK